MAIQMRRGNLADFDPTKQMPGEFAVTLDTDNNLNKRVYITFAAGTVKQLMTVEDAQAQMIEATDAATAEAEAWAHGNSFTATEMFTSAGSATVTLAYSPSSINAVKINDVATTAYTRNGKVITFNTAPAVGSTITVIYSVSTSTDNAKYYKEQAANSASTASTKATQASTSATNAANSASTASTKATQAGNSATLSESYAVGGTGTRPGEDTDNAKYYKDQMAAYLSGIYHFIGSVNSYADLPTMGMVRGDTYDILTADPTHEIAAGDNVAWTGTKWDKLSGTIATMIGATASSNGAKGLVPAPMIADKDNFLRGDGTWANPNTAVDDVYSVMGYMGAKNLIPYPYYESDHTESGITWTVNSDGSVTANGTATANSTFIFRNRTEQTKFVEKNTSYIFSGCPSGGSSSTYAMIFFVKNEDDSNVVSGAEYGNGRKIDMPNQDYYGIYAFARVFSGQTVSNLTFKPMLRLAEDTDDTYQPYAKTNRQLTDELSGKQDTLSFDDVPTQNSGNPVKSGGIKTYVDNAVSPKINKTAIQMGKGVFPPAEVGVQTVTVNFPTAFTHIPQVMVSWDDTPALPTFFKYSLKIENITTKGFTVQAERLNASANWWFRYIAVDNQ
jgi:hypothetical protein